jgi:DNA phosphorothioation-associated putative methyltransferase
MADEAGLDLALRTVPFGKVLPDAVYIHVDYLADLPPLVRVYVGSGRVLVGDVPNTTIVKMSRQERRISFLSYPDFERDPHPSLVNSLRVDLCSFSVKWRSFADWENPPVLHRKEAFVPERHPSRSKFASLTRQEERAGLFSDSTRIGTRAGWDAALAVAGKALRGHRLVDAASEKAERG